LWFSFGHLCYRPAAGGSVPANPKANNMNRMLAASLAAAAIAAAPGAFAADPPPIEVTSAPSAVTVSPDGATVTRTGEVDLPAGDSVLVLHGIPRWTARDSVTASGQATTVVLIGAVETRQHTSVPVGGDGRLEDIRAAIRDTDARIAAVDVRIAGFRAQEATILRLAGISGGVRTLPQPAIVPGPAAASVKPGFAAQTLPSSGVTAATTPDSRLADNPRAWKEAWTLVREGITDSEQGLLAARAERQVLEQKHAGLQSELVGAAVSENQLGRSMDIAVAVHADAPARFRLVVTYRTPGASWHPVYDARLATGTGRMVLSQEAVVSQITGEDWNGVALTLSTARPSAGTQPPELEPIHVRLIGTAKASPINAGDSISGVMAGSMGARLSAIQDQMSVVAAAPAPAGAPTPSVIPAGSVHAVLETGGVTADYRVPGLATIHADGTERKVAIADNPEQAVLSGLVVPKAEAKAYLQAKFTSTAAEPLLPGKVSLYLDGVFVGLGKLPPIRPGEETSLSFGPDDKIKVTYEPQGDRSGKDGYLIGGKKTTISRASMFAVKSFHKAPIEITVTDQLPVSGDDDLKVEMAVDPQPTAEDFQDRKGTVAWTFPCKPGEERRIHFGYTMTAPEGKQIIGMPAR